MNINAFLAVALSFSFLDCASAPLSCSSIFASKLRRVDEVPVPSNAEIAFEGLIHPDDRIPEGPLGEWTGYYASGSDLEPAIRIDTLMYRNDPILMGAIPAVPPNDNTFYFGSYRCGAVWNQPRAGRRREG